MTFEQHPIVDSRGLEDDLAGAHSRGPPLALVNAPFRSADDASSLAGVSGRKLSRPLRMHQDSTQVASH
jgi:hypothetical protein